MSVRVRMAPSPTWFLHIGGVRTFLFNWLFARGRGGECRLRIENTDTSREVAESVEQIQGSLRWLGIDWDGSVTFQLDAMPRCEELVLVRSDGRPTYNFASPVEDMLDGITHVIRSAQHVSNTPKQIVLLRAL